MPQAADKLNNWIKLKRCHLQQLFTTTYTAFNWNNESVSL